MTTHIRKMLVFWNISLPDTSHLAWRMAVYVGDHISWFVGDLQICHNTIINDASFHSQRCSGSFQVENEVVFI